MATEEILWMPGEWTVGDRVKIMRGDEVLLGGRIKEIVGNSLYKVDVEEGGVAARAKRAR